MEHPRELFKSYASFHPTELPAEVMNVGSQGRTSTLEGGSHFNPPGMCVHVCVRPARMQCSYKGQRLGVGRGQAVQHGTQTLQSRHTHTHKCTGKTSRCRTFNLPADLCEVGHPFEDFGVSGLVSMRRLQREEEERGIE